MKTKFISSALLLLILQSCGTISNDRIIEGKVIDPSKSPASYASVDLLLNNKVISSKMCDIDGKFRFDSLQDGEYSLIIQARGANPKKINPVLIANGESEKIEIVLDALAHAEPDYAPPPSRPSPIKSSGDETSLHLSDMLSDKEASEIKSVRGYTYSWSTNVIAANGCATDNTNSYYQPEEQYDQIVENEFLSTMRSPLSTFSIDVDKASYSNARRIIESGQLPPADAVRIEEMINYFNYDYPKPQGDNIIAMYTEATKCPWNNTNILLRVALKAKDIDQSKLPPSNFVFLIDVSGSMDEPNKLPLVKQSLKILINQLEQDDRIAIVVYAGNAGLILKPTSGSNKEAIRESIDRLQAGGSTAGGEGIKLAYKLAAENFDAKKNNRVILCTDGDFNVGIQSDGDLVNLIEKERNKGIFLSVLGYGMGNYKDAKMEKLADKGNGNNFYIDDFMEAEKVLGREMKGSLYTLAKDVKLQVEFNPSIVSEYRLIGYENRMLNTEDFDNDKKDAGELGAGQEVTALYELIPVTKKETTNTNDLRYHVMEPSPEKRMEELGAIRFRYKQPLDSVSKLYTHIINSEIQPFEKTSSDLQFACAVTEYSLVLRNSKFAGTANLQYAMELAKKNKGEDEFGDRSEFVKLCRQAITITESLSSK